jgi:hypothetical protein
MPPVAEPNVAPSPSAAPSEPGKTPGRPAFESFGRYPTYQAELKPLHWQGDFPRAVDGIHHGVLPVGMGSSYGDVCLLKGGTLLQTTSMNRLLNFDYETGILTAETGITLAQIRLAPSTSRLAVRSPTTSTARTTRPPARLVTTFLVSSWFARTAKACSARPPKILTCTRQPLVAWDLRAS